MISSHHNSKVGHSVVSTSVRRLLQLKNETTFHAPTCEIFHQKLPALAKASTWVIPNPASFFYHLHQCSNIVQCLNIDHIGPLPGYILVIICTFTMGRMTQNTWRHCYIYSFPRIRSDNGLYFAADVVKQFLLLWGVQPVKHYYTPVNTSIVERAIITFVHYEESLSFMQSFLN